MTDWVRNILMILSKINLKLLVETLKQTTYCLYYVKLCSIWLEKNIYSILCHQGINNVYEGKKRIQKFYLSKKFISPIILGAQVIVTGEYQILVFFFFLILCPFRMNFLFAISLNLSSFINNFASTCLQNCCYLTAPICYGEKKGLFFQMIFSHISFIVF